MGSSCDMRSANRSAAVYGQDGTFLDPLRKFIGATIEELAMVVNDPIGTISACFKVRLPNGETEALEGPRLAETCESGVAGFDLQDQYGENQLRQLLAAAIEDRGNDLDDDDRHALRAEISDLPNYYRGG